MLLIGLVAFALGILITHLYAVKETRELWTQVQRLTRPDTNKTKGRQDRIMSNAEATTPSAAVPSPGATDETLPTDVSALVEQAKETLDEETKRLSTLLSEESTGTTAAGAAESVMGGIRQRVRGRPDARGVGNRHQGQDSVWSKYKTVTDRAELFANVFLYGPITDVHVAFGMLLDSLDAAGRYVERAEED